MSRKFSGIGRRTGVNVREGKHIRSAANGLENFADYWSEESDTDSDDISSSVASSSNATSLQVTPGKSRLSRSSQSAVNSIPQKDSNTFIQNLVDDKGKLESSAPNIESEAHLNNKTYAKSLSRLSFDAAQTAVRTSTPYRGSEKLGFSKSSIRPTSPRSSYDQSSAEDAESDAEESESENLEDERPAEDKATPANIDSIQGQHLGRSPRRLTMRDASAYTTWSDSSIKERSAKKVVAAKSNAACSPMRKSRRFTLTDTSANTTWQNSLGSDSVNHVSFRNTACSPMIRSSARFSTVMRTSPRAQTDKDKNRSQHVIDKVGSNGRSSSGYIDSPKKSPGKQLTVPTNIRNSPHQQKLFKNSEVNRNDSISNKMSGHNLRDKTKFCASPAKGDKIDQNEADFQEVTGPNSQSSVTTVVEQHYTGDYEPIPDESENEMSSPRKRDGKKRHSPEKRSPKKGERSVRHEIDYELNHSPQKTVHFSKENTRESFFNDGEKDIESDEGLSTSQSERHEHRGGKVDNTSNASGRHSTSKMKRKRKHESCSSDRDQIHDSDLRTRAKSNLDQIRDVESPVKIQNQSRHRRTSKSQSGHSDIDSNILLDKTKTRQKSLMIDNSSENDGNNNITGSPGNHHGAVLKSPKETEPNKNKKTRGKPKKTKSADGRKSPRPVRKRIKPLRHWANERQFVSRTPGGSYVVEVIEGTKVIPFSLNTRNKKITDNNGPKKEITVLGLKEKIFPFNFKESLEWLQPRDTMSFSMAKCFGSKDIQFGYLKIAPSEMKPEQLSPSSNLHFCVIRGLVNVCIHKTFKKFSVMDSFIVPMKNSYSIQNLSDTIPAVLSFTRFEEPIFG